MDQQHSAAEALRDLADLMGDLPAGALAGIYVSGASHADEARDLFARLAIQPGAEVTGPTDGFVRVAIAGLTVNFHDHVVCTQQIVTREVLAYTIDLPVTA